MDRQNVSDIAFTPVVKAMQEQKGSRRSYAKMEAGTGWHDRVTDELRDFLAERDSFYLGTANREGQPYIQHRGGPSGFLRVLDDHTLGFADFSGNKQYITAATLQENSRAFIFLMDYPNRRRIKIWGHARVVEGDSELLRRLVDAGYKGRPERAIVFSIEAWDANCPQHIRPRFTEEEVLAATSEFRARIEELEAEVARLKAAS